MSLLEEKVYKKNQTIEKSIKSQFQFKWQFECRTYIFKSIYCILLYSWQNTTKP